ncbi:MAG TPA: alpha/beta fold hydrolase [Kofleriaceae bacterium]|nr:alpha/beta fold hydrolase [Kofleriaceae bacterium]
MPPLVLLHGFAHTPGSWQEVAASLGGELHPWPTPGHDATAPVAATWDETIAGLAATLPAGAIAVGYSYGARVALGLLAHDAVEAAVLIGVNPGLADPDARALRRTEDARWAELLRARGTEAFLVAWEAQPLFTSQVRAPAAVRARRRAERSSLDPAALAGALEVLGLGAMPDLGPALAARADRAHLVVGADDYRFRTIAGDLAARTGIPVDVVDDSGHDPTLEAPAALATIIARAVSRLTT